MEGAPNQALEEYCIAKDFYYICKIFKLKGILER